MKDYEKFREEGWKSYEDGAKVISYFCKREANQPEVTGIEFKPPESHFEQVWETKKVIALLKEKMLTKSGSVRKKILDKPDWELAQYAALYHYLSQAMKEKSNKVLLSKREVVMILGK